MGFFKKVFKKEHQEISSVPPPMPTSQKPAGGDLSDIPPAPKPLDMAPPGAPEASPPGTFSEPDTDFSIPPLDSSFSDNPISESPFIQDKEVHSPNFDQKLEEPSQSFAEKFGTHPDPEIESEVHEAHEEIQSEVPETNELKEHEKFSFGSEPILDELNLVSPREGQNDKKISPNELPLHEQVDTMIDEHVEEKIQENILEIHEEIPMPPPTFTPIKHYEEKPVQIPLSKNIDPNKPLFVRLEFCGDLVRELSYVRSALKAREDDYISFQNLENQLNNTYNNWRGSLGAIQSSLIKMDKMIFKD